MYQTYFRKEKKCCCLSITPIYDLNWSANRFKKKSRLWWTLTVYYEWCHYKNFIVASAHQRDRSLAMYLNFFRDFIQYCVLANWKRDHIMDQHWSPVVESCKVCDSYYHRFDFYSTYWFLSWVERTVTCIMDLSGSQKKWNMVIQVALVWGQKYAPDW